ncbi:RagB/SusD family nutrient uptake outer membrane protein [Pseudoflavitalea rhizosphaerae]|uniref:RagB/SusD family nutrient uptake outer membrane protein n=1 Tax=Pseudoflavitalea rhizosphaerae TaxID=1884793 RepID=UPI000F8DFA4B|nr:RagB/SusD family nutrient uptake outer membrane protein [Pseudoflavitalea rhizosphaerae]
MKNKYFYKNIILSSVAAIMGLSSCNKQLDLKPSDDIDPSKAFRNVKDVNAGVLGAYSALNYYSSIFYTTRITDEVMLPSENSTGSGVATYRWQYDGTFQHDAYYDNYKAIDRLNRVLAAVDDIPALAGEETELKAQYKGELLAMRAYCHFELIRNFASGYVADSMGVIYMERSELSRPARLSFGATMEKINADLIAAKDLIPASFDDNTRITKLAVSAIQARVALYEKNWPNAIKYATEVINGMPLASRANFPKIWHEEAPAEVIWKLKRVPSDDETPLGNVYTQETFLTNPAGSRIYYAASHELTDLFDQTNDIRFSSYIVIDPQRLADGKMPNAVIKYTNNGATNRNLVDIKLFRTGEMYLIRSEAYAGDGQLGLGIDDLNDLRAARISGYVDQTFANKDALLAAIEKERFKELAFEGHRHHDLRRWNLPITRLPQDAVNALGAVNLPPTKAQYRWPIPNSELRVNPNLKQNPFY